MSREKFIELCEQKMEERGLNSPNHKKRFEDELWEIDAQAEHEYFLRWHQKKAKFANNENNLFVPYLLGLVDEFDIEEKVKTLQGEFPDIDVDYISSAVQEYMKVDWAPKTFGAENVCNIGNYTTFGIKSSLVDMARVHGYDRNEILAITTKIGLKDEEGDTLTWEAALEMYEELKQYCDEHPDVAEAAKRLNGRNRGIGQHAGGLIIANAPIANVVPLIRGKEGKQASAWPEGLNTQDLQPVGYIKFDVLVVKDLYRVAMCNKLIKERHGIKSICALPGQPDWSDTSYLNDPKALALANEARLKGIFQFDSAGIRRIVKEGGVSSFDDLATYAAIYRPGPLSAKMHEIYFANKKDRSWYAKAHDLIKPIVKNTHGIYAYQEQIMQILHKVGGIPLIHCEKVRKAISKKTGDVFAKYKDIFIENGQKNLGWSKEEVEVLWKQLEGWAGYGFNKAHTIAYTYLSSKLLWQKAHYPLEFFTTCLQCEEDSAKLKDYKLDANRFGIEVCSLDLEKSGTDFSIHGDKIYIGYAKIKGIGLEVAQEIVDKKPYRGIRDFFERFGTNASVAKPLISLGLFGENRKEVFEYYEFFKTEHKKREDHAVKYEIAKAKRIEDLQTFWKEARPDDEVPTEELYMKIVAMTEGCPAKKAVDKVLTPHFGTLGIDVKGLWSLTNKYKRTTDNHNAKMAEWAEIALDYDSFSPAGVIQDPNMAELLDQDMIMAEVKSYGFGWEHPMEKSPGYDGGKTFFQFEEDDGLGLAPVEVHIVEKPVKKVAKNGKTTYYTVKVEDADFTRQSVTFWEDDFKRFEEELNFWEGDIAKGNYLRMSITKGFGKDGRGQWYTFCSPPKHQKWKIPKEKELDGRLLLLKRPYEVDLSRIQTTQTQKGILVKEIYDSRDY